jgi:hypothetical protein
MDAEPIDARLPTSYPPGSPGKVLVLEARAQRGLPLFHLLDAAGDGEPIVLPLAARKRGWRILRGEARAVLVEGLRAGMDRSALARKLGVHRSTLWRAALELRRAGALA